MKGGVEMKIETMRSEISKVYSGTGWAKKVKRMPDSQVLAIYYNFLKNDRFKKKKEKPKSSGKEHVQLCLFDLATGEDYSCETTFNTKGEVIGTRILQKEEL